MPRFSESEADYEQGQERWPVAGNLICDDAFGTALLRRWTRYTGTGDGQTSDVYHIFGYVGSISASREEIRDLTEQAVSWY